MPYNDDDLIDYWGIDNRTHQDEYCTDVLNQVLSDWSRNYLASEDEELLEKYVPKLFNTLPLENDLYYTMNIFLMIVNGYRLNKVEWVEQTKKWSKQTKSRESKPFGKKGKEEKTQKLQTKINEIKNLIGEKNIPEIQLDWLNSMLDEAYQVPHGRAKNSHAHKAVIKSYLVGLKLHNRTDTIEKFIKELD